MALISLALAISANTTIFTLLNSVLLRNLRAPRPEQLVQLFTVTSSGRTRNLTLPMFREIENSQQVFSSMFGWWGDAVLSIESSGGLVQGEVWAVSGNFYSELAAVPFAGRLLTPSDVQLDDFNPSPVAVMGYGFWQRNYGGDPAVLGKSIRIEGIPFTIIGIMNPGFTGMSIAIEPDITVPVTVEPLLTGDAQGEFGVDVAGRLKDGVTLAQAHSELESLWLGLRSALIPPSYSGKEREEFLSTRLEVDSIARGIEPYIRERYTSSLYTMMGITGVILLIACVNLASLMLARTSGHSRELGVRVALGASRWQIARPVLIESLLLSLTGGIIGFLIAPWSSHALANFMLRMLAVPEALNLKQDIRLFGFTAGVVILTGVLAGLPAVWKASRQNPMELLQKKLSMAGIPGPRIGQILVITQVALSVLLLIGAGLFVRNLRELRLIDPGFRSKGVLLMGLDKIPGNFKAINTDSYYPELVHRISRLPGVQSVSLANLRPGNASPWNQQVSAIPSTSGRPGQSLQASLAIVTPGFFETLKMQVLQGRDFSWNDDDHAPRVAVLSQNLARRLFPDGEYLGRRIQVGDASERQNIEIVGVVSDARLYNLRQPESLVVFVPFLQEQEFFRSTNPRVQVRVAVNPAAMIQSVRHEIELSGYQYASWTTTLAEVEDMGLLQERITAMLAGFLGVLALLLVSIGLYGLLAYEVLRRTKDIGIRLALGAERMSILRMVLREAMVLVLAGMAVGLPLALVSTKVIASLLFAISRTDGPTFVLAPIVLLVAGVLAGYLPARRAMHFDPAILLRSE